MTAALPAAALAGASTGARSFTALAAVVATVDPDAPQQPERALGHPAVQALFALGAVQELVLDKLAVTPSRLEVAGFGARLVTAAGAGALLARRAAARPVPPPGEPADPAPPAWTPWAAAGIGAATAAATAWLGLHWRRWAASALGRDWPGALLEDVATAALATAAVRGV